MPDTQNMKEDIYILGSRWNLKFLLDVFIFCDYD